MKHIYMYVMYFSYNNIITTANNKKKATYSPAVPCDLLSVITAGQVNLIQIIGFQQILADLDAHRVLPLHATVLCHTHSHTDNNQSCDN